MVDLMDLVVSRTMADPYFLAGVERQSATELDLVASGVEPRMCRVYGPFRMLVMIRDLPFLRVWMHISLSELRQLHPFQPLNSTSKDYNYA